MEIDVLKFTPMMKQYWEIKSKHMKELVFYRLGDFYEMFFDDALIASKELGLTLTGRDCGLDEKAPMCGVPYHSVDTYIDKLVLSGYNVAICEQVESPEQSKGIVKREIVRVVTPSTLMDIEALDKDKNNYLLSIYIKDNNMALAVADILTGYFAVKEIKGFTALANEIAKFSPSEIILSEQLTKNKDKQYRELKDIESHIGIKFNYINKEFYELESSENAIINQLDIICVDGLGIKDRPFSIIAAGSLLQYVEAIQKGKPKQIIDLKILEDNIFMTLDDSTRRNLELFYTLRDRDKKGSLFNVLDNTMSAMGARYLRNMLENPLLQREGIIARLDAVEELKNNSKVLNKLRELLDKLYDLERLMGRITYQNANARDLLAFKYSLEYIPEIKNTLNSFNSILVKELFSEIDSLEDIHSLLDKAVYEEAGITLREGNLIKKGFNKDIDEYRLLKNNAKALLNELEEKTREETSIKNLKIKYNKVFGYYFEVTNSYLDRVPDYFERKQTLTGSERYTTPELHELEKKIVGANELLLDLEYSLFCKLRLELSSQVNRVSKTTKAISYLDALQSLAILAEASNYVKPEIVAGGDLFISEGRHPVIEAQLKSGASFVANDTYMDMSESLVSIITGPNMAGKSTYMRQVAIITLMAHIGSFVPAKTASIPIVDRIFTRVGASDDLARGQSTFMVEMWEMANILRNATKNSLVILDEIGRGTGTIDGLSIAWAVVEYIASKKLGAKTLFATHYHELSELEGKIFGIKNYSIGVKESGENIIFLRKIKRGGSDKSYGIQVARLAGVPKVVINRAMELMKELENNDLVDKLKSLESNGTAQINIFDNLMDSTDEFNDDLIEFDNKYKLELADEIRDLDIDSLTAREALDLLYSFQERLKNVGN